MKVIGIVGWKTGDNSFGVTVAYLEYFSQFGQVEILTPSNDIRTDLDLLVLPGGQDMLTTHYNQLPSFNNSNPDIMKEFFYHNNLQGYIDERIPIFGICLGIQQLNVKFGGSLDQNCGHEYSLKDRSELVHAIKFTEKYRHLKNQLGYTKDAEIKVNSMHHQGVPLDGLSEDFNPIALGDFDIVEAMQHKTLPIVGVQWHPEELWDRLAVYLITDLLENTSKATKKVEMV